MEAECQLLKQHRDYRLIPTPRKISSECGFSIVSPTILSTAEGLEHIYTITNEGRNKDYEEIC